MQKSRHVTFPRYRYQTYAERTLTPSMLEGVDVVSVSEKLVQADNRFVWELLAEQYQIEHQGTYPANHMLCMVSTVLNIDDVVDIDKVSEYLFMDDRNATTDRYPSFLHPLKQISPPETPTSFSA